MNEEFKLLGTGTTNPGTISANNLNTAITTPLDRYSVFGNAHFDITDNASVFLQANMSSMKVDTVLTFAPATSQWNATIPVDGRALPPQLASLLASRPNPTAPYSLSRTLDFAGPRTTQQQHRHVPGAGRSRRRPLQHRLELRGLLLPWQDRAADGDAAASRACRTTGPSCRRRISARTTVWPRTCSPAAMSVRRCSSS